MHFSRSTALLLVGSFLALSPAAHADYCINKDLINLGPTAYDLAAEITGNQAISLHYDGWAGAFFNSFTVTPSGANEILHWQNLNGSNAPIPTGDPLGAAQVHIGWCTVNPNNLVNMYWTDLAGNAIPDSIVYQVGGHASASATPGVQWDNASNHPLVVTNVYYTLSRTPWKLGALNRDNTVLSGQLRALAGGGAITIPAGGRATLNLPGARPGDWVVLRYGVKGTPTSRSAAVVTDWVQYQIR